MLLVGLTGGIGCGKSVVSEQFADLGVPVIDADQIGHALTAPGQPLLKVIADTLGKQFIKAGQTLDRAALRAHVFAHPAARAQLEAILHPAIRDAMRQQLAGLDDDYAVLVIPLLLESGQRDLVDRILVVDCPPALQRQRVLARDGLSEAELERILAAQLDRGQRLAAADDIIVNAGSLDDIRQAVIALDRKYRDLARHGGFTRPAG